jgi:hypothetical protein
MNKSYKILSSAERQRAVAIAVASVRAEGLEPSKATKSRLAQYAKGHINAEQLRQESLAEAKTLALV